MKQVRIYTRGNQESVMNQINELVSYYDKMEDVIIRNIYADVYPKKGMKQFDLEVMLHCLNEGEIILVTSLDRLSRNVNELHEILRKIEEVGAELIVVKEQNSMIQQFMAENYEEISTVLLETKELQKKVRKGNDTSSSEEAYEKLRQSVIEHYEATKNEGKDESENEYYSSETAQGRLYRSIIDEYKATKN